MKNVHAKFIHEDILDGLHWLGLHWEEGPDVGGPFRAISSQTEKNRPLSWKLLTSS